MADASDILISRLGLSSPETAPQPPPEAIAPSPVAPPVEDPSNALIDRLGLRSEGAKAEKTPSYSDFGFTPIPSTSGQSAAITQPPKRAPEDWVSSLMEHVNPTKKVEEGGVINDKYEPLPDLFDMKELHELSPHRFAVTLGTLAAGPEGVLKILKKHFPETHPRMDGNYVIATSKDGKEYAYKPGFRPSDIPRAVVGTGLGALGAAAIGTGVGALGSAVTPAAAAAVPEFLSGLGTTAAAALTLEDAKAAAGGDFSATNVVVAPSLHGLLQAGGKGLQLGGKLAGAIGKKVLGALEPGTPAGVAGEAGSAVAPGVVAPTSPVGPPAPESSIVSASGALAEEPPAPPVHATPPAPQTPISRSLSDRAEQLMKDVGQELDQGKINTARRGEIQGLMNDHLGRAQVGFKTLDKTLRGAEVHAENGLGIIKQLAEEAGGLENLPGWVQGIARDLEPQKGTQITSYPKYPELDSARKLAGDKLNGVGGPYPARGKEKGIAKLIYGALRKDQYLAAEQEGLGSEFLKSQDLYDKYFDLRKRVTSLFGKQTLKAVDGAVQLEGNMMARIGKTIPGLGKNDFEAFVKLMRALPEGMSPEVLRSVLASKFGNLAAGEPFNILAFDQWYRGMAANSEALGAFNHYIGPEGRAMMKDLAELSRKAIVESEREANQAAVQAASKKASVEAGKRAIQDKRWELEDVRREKADVMSDVRRLDAEKRIVDLEARQKAKEAEEVKGFFARRVHGMAHWGGVPGWVGAELSQLSKSAAFNRVLYSPAMKRLTDFAGVPVSERARWLQQSLALGLVGSGVTGGDRK